MIAMTSPYAAFFSRPPTDRRSALLLSLVKKSSELPANYVPSSLQSHPLARGLAARFDSIIRTMVTGPNSPRRSSTLGANANVCSESRQTVQAAIRRADWGNLPARRGRRGGRAQPPPLRIHRRADAGPPAARDDRRNERLPECPEPAARSG